jgi:cysteine dioxygenase
MDIYNLSQTVTSKLRENKSASLASMQSLIDIATQTIPNDLGKYKIFNQTTYKRNLVYRDNLLEVFVLCWRRGQTTPYHLHPNRGCVYKIISGTLKETIKHGDTNCKRILREGDYGYIDNQIGSHQMECVSEETVSLHFYSPSGFYDPELLVDVETNNAKKDGYGQEENQQENNR